MNAIITEEPQAGYEQDFYAWTQQQAALVRARRFEALDIENLAEEIDSMGNEVLRAVKSFMYQILVHLCYLRYSRASDLRSHWVEEVDNFRGEIERRLEGSPSLRPQLPEALQAEWRWARRKVQGKLADEGARELPAKCPFTLAQLLDYDHVSGERP